LAGTLPMLTGTGEAPCGVICADRLALPAGYESALLVASWGDAALELYRLQPQGASFRATKENLVAGEKKLNEAFCPVDFAAAPDGSLYVTDWADRTSYPVHGKGRIWRLAAKKAEPVQKPAYAQPLAETNAAALRLARLLGADSPAQVAELKAALTDADPFIRSAAMTALTRPALREAAAKFVEDHDPLVRLGALVASWRTQPGDPVPLLRRALADPDEWVRMLALRWAGEDRVSALGDELSRAVADHASPGLFQAWLAAAELLASEPYTPAAKPDPAGRQQLLARILHDDAHPAAMHAMAAAAVTTLSDAKTAERLLHVARRGEAQVRREAIRTVAGCPDPKVPAVLKSLALDPTQPAALRAEAILSLSRRDAAQLPALAGLLDDREHAVRWEAARALRLAASDAAVRRALQEKLTSLGDPTSPFAGQLQFALGSAKRPGSPAEWRAALADGGDAEAGERVFLSVQTGCTSCHQAQGRGTAIGPDLSNVASAFDRTKLIDAILDPSREIAPQYEQHIVETKSGAAYAGVLIHIGLDGAPLVNAIGTGRIRVPVAQIARHETSKLSLMPAGLEAAMSVEDFRNLIAFLLTLKPEPPGKPLE
jgi:putative heme-binding domain-containing protein